MKIIHGQWSNDKFGNNNERKMYKLEKKRQQQQHRNSAVPHTHTQTARTWNKIRTKKCAHITKLQVHEDSSINILARMTISCVVKSTLNSGNYSNRQLVFCCCCPFYCFECSIPNPSHYYVFNCLWLCGPRDRPSHIRYFSLNWIVSHRSFVSQTLCV